MKETTADGSPPGITDKGEFIHYTFQRFQCLTQQKRFGGPTQSQLASAQQVGQELQQIASGNAAEESSATEINK